MAWSEEHILSSGEEYFSRLIHAIRQAHISIEFESYIFEMDGIGKILLSELRFAAGRGVEVRILVDGIGAPQWVAHAQDRTNEPFKVRVFHPVPWPYSVFLWDEFWRVRRWFRYLSRMNSRNHKKLIVIDSELVFLGSINVWEQSLKWRELSAELRGPSIEVLRRSFELNWLRSFYRRQPLLEKWLRPRVKLSELRSDDVLLNYPRRLRRIRNKEFMRRLRTVDRQIKLVTAYFVPSVRLLRTLCRAGKAEKDVSLMVPLKSDVRVVDWLLPIVAAPLLRSGVKIYQYEPTVLHAKYAILDHWYLLGTSNLNRRSTFLDLEVDAVLSHDKSKAMLEEIFSEDIKQCQMLTLDALRLRPWWQRWLGRLALTIRVLL